MQKLEVDAHRAPYLLVINSKVPMLDIQVWINKSHGDPDTVMWSFYEKPTASSSVLRAGSAYSWRSKLVTLGMEVFRRARNTSRQVTMESRISIVCDLVLKMRKSGYIQATVEGILESGLTMYYRKQRIDLQGGPPLNRRDESNTVQKRRQKLGASESWFARRRGGKGESNKKENNWRFKHQDQQIQEPGQSKMRQHPRKNTTRRQGQSPTDTSNPNQEKKVLTALLVEYTIGSKLKSRVQNVEDQFSQLTGGGRVRVE